jgi:hypothetical protein
MLHRRDEAVGVVDVVLGIRAGMLECHGISD